MEIGKLSPNIQAEMMKQLILGYFLLGVVLLLSENNNKKTGTVLLENVNIVDVVNEEVIPRQHILLKGGRVAHIGAADASAELVAEQKLDLEGKYIIPGLWDMHAHPDDPELWRMLPTTEEKDLLMPLFVINGVTGIRDMGGDIQLIKRWRNLAKEELLLVPKIFAAGPLLDGPNPMWDGSVGIASAGKVKHVVDSLIYEGVDFLKVYSLLPRDTFLALSEYANAIDYPFVGHVPFTVAASEAAKVGMKSQEHLLEILKECSEKPSEQYLAELRKQEDQVDRANKINDFRLNTFNEVKAGALYDVFKKYDVWHCPTLSMWYKNAWYESELLKDKEKLALLPPYLRAYWTPEQNDHLRYRDNQRFVDTKKRLYKLYLKMVYSMHQKGVKLLAGTDMGANPLCLPGVGVHNELKAFVDAGLSPAEALKTATLNPALFFEIEKDYGTVTEGKVADLVILDANPLERIENISRISSVIQEGKVISSTELARIKDAILQANVKN